MNRKNKYDPICSVLMSKGWELDRIVKTSSDAIRSGTLAPMVDKGDYEYCRVYMSKGSRVFKRKLEREGKKKYEITICAPDSYSLERTYIRYANSPMEAIENMCDKYGWERRTKLNDYHDFACITYYTGSSFETMYIREEVANA